MGARYVFKSYDAFCSNFGSNEERFVMKENRIENQRGVEWLKVIVQEDDFAGLPGYPIVATARQNSQPQEIPSCPSVRESFVSSRKPCQFAVKRNVIVCSGRSKNGKNLCQSNVLSLTGSQTFQKAADTLSPAHSNDPAKDGTILLKHRTTALITVESRLCSREHQTVVEWWKSRRCLSRRRVKRQQPEDSPDGFELWGRRRCASSKARIIRRGKATLNKRITYMGLYKSRFDDCIWDPQAIISLPTVRSPLFYIFSGRRKIGGGRSAWIGKFPSYGRRYEFDGGGGVVFVIGESAHPFRKTFALCGGVESRRKARTARDLRGVVLKGFNSTGIFLVCGERESYRSRSTLADITYPWAQKEAPTTISYACCTGDISHPEDVHQSSCIRGLARRTIGEDLFAAIKIQLIGKGSPLRIEANWCGQAAGIRYLRIRRFTVANKSRFLRSTGRLYGIPRYPGEGCKIDGRGITAADCLDAHESDTKFSSKVTSPPLKRPNIQFDAAVPGSVEQFAIVPLRSVLPFDPRVRDPNACIVHKVRKFSGVETGRPENLCRLEFIRSCRGRLSNDATHTCLVFFAGFRDEESSRRSRGRTNCGWNADCMCFHQASKLVTYKYGLAFNPRAPASPHHTNGPICSKGITTINVKPPDANSLHRGVRIYRYRAVI
ncbi:hypothetical protein GEV33_011905 [Tenebrio molitor]|uniref:Uncharacterized protein n=1 Tax=Tenebrio molitor TaxID=7067 RepID=A0A8J6HB99_TENMO|nr:hypothetical protein GEV33_011905 [Tenebrio molitor]